MPGRDTVEIKCPECGRFLAEAAGYGRAVCSTCGWEVAVTSKARRAELRAQRPRDTYPMAGVG